MSSVSSTDRMQENYDSALASARDAHERDLEKVSESSSEDVTVAKKEYNEKLRQIKAEAQQDIKKLKEEMYDSKGKRISAEAKDMQIQKDQLRNYKDELTRENDRAQKRIERGSKSNSEQVAQIVDQKLQDAIQGERSSSHAQLKELRDQLATYQNHGNDLEREKAIARAKGVQETEGEYLKDRGRIQNTFEHQIKDMNAHQAEVQDMYARKVSEADFAATANAEHQLKAARAGYELNFKNELSNSRRNEEVFKSSMKNEQDRNERGMMSLYQKNELDRNQMAGEKDKAFRQYLGEHDNRVNYEINQKDAEISQLKTTDGPLKVSPFLVEKLRIKNEIKNEKSIEAVRNAEALNRDAIQKRALIDRTEMQDDQTKKMTDYTREHQHNEDNLQRRFSSSYQDLNNLRTVEKDNLNQRHMAMAESQKQKFEGTQALQERRMKESLEAQRDMLHLDKNQVIDEVEQKAREDKREWSMKTNDVHHTYEKKMIEQQDEHERQMAELRYDSDKKLREQERNFNRNTESRVKGYEHQIKQQELAFKEREKFLVEHYEEELDKLKRSNAHLTTKKS